MAQLCAAVAALHSESKFAKVLKMKIFIIFKCLYVHTCLMPLLIIFVKPRVIFQAYQSGIPKKQYWEYVYEDAMDLIAKLPPLAG